MTFLGAAEEAFKTNATIIAALTSVNNRTKALENAVNGADTVVDIWNSIEPTIGIIQASHRISAWRKHVDAASLSA